MDGWTDRLTESVYKSVFTKQWHRFHSDGQTDSLEVFTTKTHWFHSSTYASATLDTFHRRLSKLFFNLRTWSLTSSMLTGKSVTETDGDIRPPGT